MRTETQCPVYDGEAMDAGPRCCDLACVWPGEREPALWEGDGA